MSTKNSILSVTLNNPHSLLTSAEVCDELRMSSKTLQRWRKAGRITHIRRGGRFLFPRTAIEKFLTARTIAA